MNLYFLNPARFNGPAMISWSDDAIYTLRPRMQRNLYTGGCMVISRTRRERDDNVFEADLKIVNSFKS